jgi:phosphodiesterase/alkaline phosphatase D-like protein
MGTGNAQLLQSGLVLLALVGGILAADAGAAVINWGGGSGGWLTPANWQGGILPTTGDTAVIASGSPAINGDLLPAPDLIRIDPGGNAVFQAVTGNRNLTNDFVLNGGKCSLAGDVNPIVLGTILLTADSTIQNTRANSNRSLTLNGAITENGTPRRLTFTGYPATPGGQINDWTYVGGTAANTYSGGTSILGATAVAQKASAFGTGPISVAGGRMMLSVAGSYTFGTITQTSGTVIINAAATNLVLDLQGGVLEHNNTIVTLNNTNSITIRNTVGIHAAGTNVNNPFTIGASIGGPGKAVLNDFGPWNGTSYSSQGRVVFTAAQNWAGGTDVNGLVDINAGGSLPAGTITVRAINPAKIYSTGGVLRLFHSGALPSGTDLVLSHDTTNNWYGSLYLGANITVHSLTIDGSLMPAGVYTQGTDLPDYLFGPTSPKYTLTVLTPDVDYPPMAITDLAAVDPQLTSIRLTWSAPRDDKGPGNAAASYDVRYSTSPITDANFDSATVAPQGLTPKGPGQAESLLVTGLTPGTTYWFAVKSTDISNNVSAISNVSSATTLTPDTSPPAAVTDLHATDVQTRRLTLTWTATGDDGDTGRATAYDVRYSTAPIDAGNFASATVVPQSLAPKAAGQTETLPVTGLTPGTTYYFALKVADEVPNVSALSNVAQAATLPPDLTPPAAVTDLAAGGADPLSATLSWTASGDDGNAGTATCYEIRYSTSMITEGTWASATPAPNSLAPKPAGAAEHFTVTGLQPSTTYYFALKVKDEEDNASGLSNVATHTTAALSDLPLVTSVVIVEKSGVATTNYPVTLSMAFRKGDVATNVIARAGGMVLATQTDVKVRWDGGSVKHALVSFLLPSLPAGGQVTVDLLAGGPNANATPMTKDQLLARDFEAQITITVGGTPTTISARQMLQNAGAVETWLAGDVVTEFLIKDFSTNINNQLNVQYRVRVYNGCSSIRVETVVENCWCQYRGNVTYDFSLSLGQSSPVVVLTKTGLTHNQLARWHKVFWQGGEPGNVQIKFDVPYLIATGLIQRYDTSLVMPESTLASQYSNWLSKPHDLMQNGIVTTYFPTTGGRQEIGVLPTWTVRWLLSMDNRQKEIMLNCADVSGYIPIHYRESDPARSFYGHIMSIDDRPTVWAGWWDYPYQSAADKLPAPVGDTTTGWSVDLAHQASFAYVPYLVTGEYYYLEEMLFWAGYDLATGNWSYRQGSTGIIQEQTRGEAWGIRNVADAANLTPDGFVEKPYLTQKVNNNLAYWGNTYVLSPNYPCIRYWQTGSNLPSGGRPDDTLAANCTNYTSPWQDDFMLLVLGHLKDIGFDSRALVNWLGTTAIDRFHAPGFNWFRGASYHIPTHYDDGAGHVLPYATWADIENAYVNPDPTSFSDNVGGYEYIARAALTRVYHQVNGRTAREWLDAHLHNQAQLATDPTMAIVPVATVVGDVNSDAHVDVSDLLMLAQAWGRSYGAVAFNPDCDFNGDASTDVADLLVIAGNWGM